MKTGFLFLVLCFAQKVTWTLSGVLISYHWIIIKKEFVDAILNGENGSIMQIRKKELVELL